MVVKEVIQSSNRIGLMDSSKRRLGRPSSTSPLSWQGIREVSSDSDKESAHKCTSPDPYLSMSWMHTF